MTFAIESSTTVFQFLEPLLFNGIDFTGTDHFVSPAGLGLGQRAESERHTTCFCSTRHPAKPNTPRRSRFAGACAVGKLLRLRELNVELSQRVGLLRHLANGGGGLFEAGGLLLSPV